MVPFFAANLYPTSAVSCLQPERRFTWYPQGTSSENPSVNNQTSSTRFFSPSSNWSVSRPGAIRCLVTPETFHKTHISIGLDTHSFGSAPAIILTMLSCLTGGERSFRSWGIFFPPCATFLRGWTLNFLFRNKFHSQSEINFSPGFLKYH